MGKDLNCVKLKLWIFDMPDGGARLLRSREGNLSIMNLLTRLSITSKSNNMSGL